MSNTTTTSKTKYDHGQSPVFFLVPVDQKERRKVNDFLEPDFNKLADPPKVVDNLRLGRLPHNAVVYVAHTYDSRERVNDEYRMVSKVHVSEPLEVKKFTAVASGDDDGLGTANVPAMTDAIQALCKNSRSGKCFRVALSAEKDPAHQTAKLFNS